MGIRDGWWLRAWRWAGVAAAAPGGQRGPRKGSAMKSPLVLRSPSGPKAELLELLRP